jgi:hypothetical protein|tara:strand:- start:19 stop:678 length:660 start_codon:yes stop_codon:yes gene_type:complete
MLTHHDKTVKNCIEIFEEIKHLKFKYIGFKDIGVPKEKLINLGKRIKDSGKELFLEVVSLNEEDEVRSAKVAVELNVDYLMGGTRVNVVSEIIKPTKIKYLPFPGKIVGHPSVLDGTIDEITKSAIDLSSNKYVYGLDLLSYRFKGNVEELIKSVVNKTKVPIVSAGSIDSEEKIKIVSALGVWAFTVGSAAFEKKFANGSSKIVDQLEDILKLSNKYK